MSEKEKQEITKKPASEVKRIQQNDQEKQRKEKIKTCIGEIAKELPPQAEQLDRKPSTLSIVSQAKEYIKKLKEQNQAYEKNLVAEQQQEELRQLREAHAAHLERIRKLEEMLKTSAIEKVTRTNHDELPSSTSTSENAMGRRRPKTINKLFVERSEMLQQCEADTQSDPSLSLLSSSPSFNHSSNGPLLSSSLLPSQPSSTISIMTVAPTILSVKSPSLGQSRNQQAPGGGNRLASTSSSTMASGRVNQTNASSFLDVDGGSFGAMGTLSSTSSNGDGSHGAMVIPSSSLPSSTQSFSIPLSACTSSSASSLMLSAASSLTSVPNILDGHSIVGLAPLMHSASNTNNNNNNSSNNNSNGGSGVGTVNTVAGNSMAAGQVATINPGEINIHSSSAMFNFNNHSEVGGNSALQTLATVATSTHMAGISGGVSLSVSQALANPVGLNVISGSAGPQQQQPPIMSIAQSDGCNSTVNCKQVIVNGQLLTVSEQPASSHLEGDCHSALANTICQPNLPVLGTMNLGSQPSNLGSGPIFNGPNGALVQTPYSGANGPPLASAGTNPIIYTLNDQGQLVQMHNTAGGPVPVSSSTTATIDLGVSANAAGNLLPSFQNSLSLQQTPQATQSHFLPSHTPVVSVQGHIGNQQPGQPPSIILPPGTNPLQPQVLPSGPLLFPQPQQQQVINLGSLGGLQIINPFTGMVMNNLGPVPAAPPAALGGSVKLIGNDIKLVPPGDNPIVQGPTHVMVDGSLIPISTNPQTFMPNPASLTSIGPKPPQIQLGNPVFQFDPSNPSAPPILLNTPGGLQLGPAAPQIIGPSLQPAPPGVSNIIQVASGVGSGPLHIAGAGGMVVASSVIASTVTTNSVASCISSVGVTTSAPKSGKSLASIAPAVTNVSLPVGSSSQASVSSAVVSSVPVGIPLPLVASTGQKVTTNRLHQVSTPKSHNRRRSSPSAARSSPVAAAEVPSQFLLQQQQQQQISSTSATVPLLSPLKNSPNEKVVRGRSLSQSKVEQDVKLKTDLLAQATATAGILMDSENATSSDLSHVSNRSVDSSGMNVSGSNMNVSGSSTELQINLKSSSCDEEDDNIQLIIDENCSGGVSSTSPAQSGFSPNINLAPALTVNASPSKQSDTVGGISPTQPLRMQMPGVELITPIVSPNIPVASSTAISEQAAEQQQLIVNAISSISSLSSSQLLSPLSTSVFTTIQTSSPSSSSPLQSQPASSTLQIVGASFRPEDMFAQLSNSLSADTKLTVASSNASHNKLPSPPGPVFNVNNSTMLSPVSSNSSTSLSTSLLTTSTPVKSYVPIAPAPSLPGAVSSTANYASEPRFFPETASSASTASDKPGLKNKSRAKKAVVTGTPASTCVSGPPKVDNPTPLVSEVDPVAEPKKKPPAKKRKTRAELRLEKEEREKAKKEEEGKKEDKDEETNAKDTRDCMKVEEESLLAVLEVNENEAVKEQILNSVSESKLLNTDGSFISLMDVVDKMDHLNSNIHSHALTSSGPVKYQKVSTTKENTVPAGEELPTPQLFSHVPKASTKGDVSKADALDTTSASVATASSSIKDRVRKRREPSTLSCSTRAENKKARKSKGQNDGVAELSLFGLSDSVATTPQSSSLASATATSDIYEFVDDDESAVPFLQPPMPAKSPTKKATCGSKKSKNKASMENSGVPEMKLSSLGVTTRNGANAKSIPVTTSSEATSTSCMISNVQLSHSTSLPLVSSSSLSMASSVPPVSSKSLSTPVSISTLHPSTAFTATLEMISPPLPSSLNSSSLPSSLSSSVPVTTSSNVSEAVSVPSSSLSISSQPLGSITAAMASISQPCPSSQVSTTMATISQAPPSSHLAQNVAKKSVSETADPLPSSLDETFPMDFTVVDFQSSPKLESHDDSIGLPPETIADFFNQEMPGKINFHTSPPNLNNPVLSPPDVDLPALRTPAPPDPSNHSEPVLMLSQNDSSKNSLMEQRSVSSVQVPSRMHTPTPERKSPVSSLVDSISTSVSNQISMPPPPDDVSPLMPEVPPLKSSCQSSNSGPKANPGFGLNSNPSIPLLDTTSTPDAQLPSLSSSSLDALPEILPLKPITSEIAVDESPDSSCVQPQRRPSQTQPLSHVPMQGDGLGMNMPPQQQAQQQQPSQPPPQQQQQQQHPLQLQPSQAMSSHQPQPHGPPQIQDVHQQQKAHLEQQQQQRQPQAHFPPQSSPHNLRPPSASSTTPLPSPKLHASPGSASNPGSVHGMSPAAQQQQAPHQCQQQQPQPQPNNPLNERSIAPPLSHPPQSASQTQNQQGPPPLSQLFHPPDSSPRNANFASPPSGSALKLKHMSPSSVHTTTEQPQPNTHQSPGNFKGYAPGPNASQPQKSQYSVDKIIDHGPGANTPVSSRMPNESFNFTNMGSNVSTTSPIPSSANMPMQSSSNNNNNNNNSNGAFSFSLSSSTAPRHPQQSSCSANASSAAGSGGVTNSSNSGGAGATGRQSTVPSATPHSSPYGNSYFAPPPPMALPSSTSPASSHPHSMAMHPLGNMEIQHTSPSSRPPPNASSSATAEFNMGPSSLMTLNHHPKLNIPPIARSPTYINNSSNNGVAAGGGGSSASGNPSSANTNNNNPPSGAGNNARGGSNATSNSSSGKSPSGNSYAGSKAGMESSANRYHNKTSAESIYQQQQKRPNTIQHPPNPSPHHMDPMSRLASSSHPNFFSMGFPSSSSTASSSVSPLSSSSVPLRHLPESRDIPSRSPYDYAVPPHPSMGFSHPHSQIPAGYGHSHFNTRDCSRLDATHHSQQPPPQQQQQQQQPQPQSTPQQPQQSPRKQTTAKKSSSNSVPPSSASASGSSSSANSHRGSNSSMGPSQSNQTASSRSTPSHHHTSHQNSSSSSSSTSNSSSQNRTSAQKRKTASHSSSSSSNSSSRKKSTASQHSGFTSEMDSAMSQNMFDPSFSYLNFPTLTPSMSPPAARPHQTDTPFLGSMFNTPTRPISNSAAKTAEMTSPFPLFHSRAQNSFFQPGSFGMNSMTGNHGNTAGLSPHSMAVAAPHMNPFGIFGNDGGASDNISSNKFLHANSILPGAPHQAMDHSLQHSHQPGTFYHNRPHAAQPHMMSTMALYPHGFDSRSHMSQFNGSMGPPPFPTHGLPPINFSVHESH